MIWDKVSIFCAMPCWSWYPFPDALFNIFYQDIDREKYEIVFDMNSLVIRQPIHVARNLLLERFVQSDCDYCYWQDDDEVANLDVIRKLVEAAETWKDIVSAIVPLRCWDRDVNLLNIFYEDESWWRQHYTDLTKEKSQVIEISNCWTGAVLMSKQVAKDMYDAYKWHPFEFVYWDYVRDIKNNKTEKYIWQEGEQYVKDEHWQPSKISLSLSEDICFFERAKELWYKIYADITAVCKHYNWRPWVRQLLNKDLRQWNSQ